MNQFQTEMMAALGLYLIFLVLLCLVKGFLSKETVKISFSLVTVMIVMFELLWLSLMLTL